MDSYTDNPNTRRKQPPFRVLLDDIVPHIIQPDEEMRPEELRFGKEKVVFYAIENTRNI